MSHFTSHVESEPVVRTVVGVQPSLLVSSATTPAPKSPIGAQLFSVQHSSLSGPVFSHVSVAHRREHASASSSQSLLVPAAHVIVEHAALALQHRSLSADPAVLSHVSVAHREAVAEESTI